MIGKLGRLGDYGKYHVSSILKLPNLLNLLKLLILPKATPPNFLSEWCRFGADMRKPPMGST